MIDELVTQYNPERLYIVELTAVSLEVIGQALHLYLGSVPDKGLANKAIDELVTQTDIVMKLSKSHSVYTGIFEAPENTIYSKQILFNPVKLI